MIALPSFREALAFFRADDVEIRSLMERMRMQLHHMLWFPVVFSFLHLARWVRTVGRCKLDPGLQASSGFKV